MTIKTNKRVSDGLPDVDARGLKCPWPALRLARAMREADTALIVADDPSAPREIEALAGEQGWSIENITTPVGTGFAVSR